MHTVHYLMIMAMLHLILARLAMLSGHTFSVFLSTMFALLFIVFSLAELYDNRRT